MLDGVSAPFDDATVMAGAGPGDATDIGGAAAGWSRPVALPRASLNVGNMRPGTKLGTRYEIVQMLGQGGMGAVYKAMDLEIGRMVALKVIKPELALNEEILQRFKQELILARRITHKSVIRIFDLGEADGVKFITMEFIEGKDLKSVVTEKGRLSFEECADIVSQICTALEAAHAEGVVHRDLKPQNVMVDKSGRVIVMDFGIARTMEPGSMTQTGALLGTPDYMSPEQVMGEHVDPRSDLFTLGVIFYELLVGALPYKADTVSAAMYKRTKETPRPPIEVDPTVPPRLSDIAAKCLQIDPTLRYQTATEIQQDIEAWRGGSTKRIPLPDPVVEKKPGISRTTMAIGAGALVVVAVAAVFISRQFFSGPVTPPVAAPPSAILAILPLHNASGDTKLDWLGSSMAGMLSTDVGQSASVAVVSADRVGGVLKDLRITPQTELDQPTVKRIAAASNADTVVWGNYSPLGDAVRLVVTLSDLKRGHDTSLTEDAANQGDILPAVDRLAAQIRKNLSISKSAVKELQLQAFKPSTQSIAALQSYESGLNLARDGKYSDAVTQFQAATKDDPQFALAFSKLAQAYSQLGQDDDAGEASLKAVNLSANLPASEKYLIEASHDQIANDYPKAIDAYQNLVKASPNNADYLFDLGTAYEANGALDKAKESFQKVVQLDPRRIEALRAVGRVDIKAADDASGINSGITVLSSALGIATETGNDVERASILQALGVAYSALNRNEEALKNLQDALDIRKRLGLKKGVSESLQMMASVQEVTGKPELALKNYLEALSIRKEIGDKQGTANVLNDLGDLYADQGKFDDALKEYKESLAGEIEVHNDAMQGQAQNNVGHAYFAKGDFQDANTNFEQALAIREKLGVKGDIADTLHNLAENSLKMGDFDKAQDQYLKAANLRRDSGDKRGQAIENSGLGVLYGYLGRLGSAVGAEKDALDALTAAKEEGFWATEVLTVYGNALAQEGNAGEAAKTLSAALAAAQSQKNQPQIGAAYNDTGDNEMYRGDLKSAAAAYASAAQTSVKTPDQNLILLSKINAAKLAVADGKFSAAASALQSLGEQADVLGLKYLSIQCLMLRGEALVGAKDFGGAQKELKTATQRSDKLNLKVLQAQSHYWMGRALELSGKAADAKDEYQQATRAADEIQKDTKNDDIKKRADLAPIFALASH